MAQMGDEDPDQTVLDNFWDTYPRLTNEEVRSTLGAFAFSQEEVERKLGQLSGGERVRLALCKIFYTRPNLLILDEPTNHMDILGKESLEKMLKSYEGTVLFVSHDRYFIRQIATQVLDITSADQQIVNAGAKNGKSSGSPAGSGGHSARQKENSYDDILRKNPGKIRSRLEHKLEKLQAQLEQSESNAAQLKPQLEDPALSADYEKLMEIQEQLDREEARQEEILTELLETEEELESISAGT